MGLLEYLDALRRSSSVDAGQSPTMTEAEAARLSQLLMQQQMDEFSRQNAFMSNPRAAQGYQQSNPLGNTMTNIAPQGGGMAVRQAPMDLSTLLRMISR